MTIATAPKDRRARAFGVSWYGKSVLSTALFLQCKAPVSFDLDGMVLVPLTKVLASAFSNVGGQGRPVAG